MQAQQGVALLDDTEHAYNREWLMTLGVDVDSLSYIHSRTVKDHLAVAQGFIEAYGVLRAAGKIKGPGLLACDSLAELSTEHELDVQLEKRDMSKAKDLKAFFRIMDWHAHAVYISTNHTIANIGSVFNKRTTSGGGGR